MLDIPSIVHAPFILTLKLGHSVLPLDQCCVSIILVYPCNMRHLGACFSNQSIVKPLVGRLRGHPLYDAHPLPLYRSSSASQANPYYTKKMYVKMVGSRRLHHPSRTSSVPYAAKVISGEDTSWLVDYERTRNVKVLDYNRGVPKNMIDRFAFTFTKTILHSQHIWGVLLFCFQMLSPMSLQLSENTCPYLAI